MKALITGGAGFIGSHVAEYFMKHDTEVHVIDNLSSGFLKNIPFVNNEHIYIKDITDFELKFVINVRQSAVCENISYYLRTQCDA